CGPSGKALKIHCPDVNTLKGTPISEKSPLFNYSGETTGDIKQTLGSTRPYDHSNVPNVFNAFTALIVPDNATFLLSCNYTGSPNMENIIIVGMITLSSAEIANACSHSEGCKTNPTSVKDCYLDCTG